MAALEQIVSCAAMAGHGPIAAKFTNVSMVPNPAKRLARKQPFNSLIADARTNRQPGRSALEDEAVTGRPGTSLQAPVGRMKNSASTACDN